MTSILKIITTTIILLSTLCINSITGNSLEQNSSKVYETNNNSTHTFLNLDHPSTAFLSFMISFITIFLIFVASYTITRSKPAIDTDGKYLCGECEEKFDSLIKWKKHRKDKHPILRNIIQFKDIIRDENWYPSLATFQFLLWTFVISFAFLSIYLIRIFNGYPLITDEIHAIPPSLLAIMGISVTGPLVSGYLSQSKYGYSSANPGKPPFPKPDLSSMLKENEKPSLPRFQMFAWTWISIMIYLVVFFSYVFDTININGNIQNLTIPDINPAFVVLMGLSQGTFIGSKFNLPQFFRITEIRPNKTQKDQSIVILGSNFGKEKKGVWFEEGKENKIKVEESSIIKWDDTNVEIKVPLNVKENTTYDIKIEKNGILTYPSAETKFTPIP